MTVTLEDVSMILGLPIDGEAVTGTLEPAGWRDRVGILVGVRPNDPKDGTKDKKPTGVSSAWMHQHFGVPPPNGADDAIVERYARAWLWHMLSGFLFPDACGNTVSWMWLAIIGQDWENLRDYSWGSTTLAWLYRQLCDACLRSGNNANIGGCYLLQIWMWEHIPVGWSDRFAHGKWPFEDDESLPTVAFPWKNIQNVIGNSTRRYTAYSNELDCLSHEHVTWQPYIRGEVQNLELSPLCTRDSQLWRSVLPLICFYIVEYHLPNRVMR